jgi:hypothetical protein
VQVGSPELDTAVGEGLPPLKPRWVKGAGTEHTPERPIALPDEVARLAEAIHSKHLATVC